MTPEEYIEKLNEVLRTLNTVKDDIDRAIVKMQRRIETGYEYLEQDSRLAASVASEYAKQAGNTIFEVAFAKIEY